VAVHINEGHVPEDGGKPWKHLYPDCPLLLERAAHGYPARRVRNVDDRKPLSEHVRRRCPVCFGSGEALKGIPTPPWLKLAQKLQLETAAGAWVYDLMYEPEQRSQVGMATNLYTRLRSRFRATCRSRFGEDCIPWYHDLLKRNPDVEVLLEAKPYATKAEALAAEDALRTRKRAQGWDVSSDV
jgi:hypothetical protein